MLIVHNPLKRQELIKSEEVSGEPCRFDRVVVIRDPSIIGMHAFGNNINPKSFFKFWIKISPMIIKNSYQGTSEDLVLTLLIFIVSIQVPAYPQLQSQIKLIKVSLQLPFYLKFVHSFKWARNQKLKILQQ